MPAGPFNRMRRNALALSILVICALVISGCKVDPQAAKRVADRLNGTNVPITPRPFPTQPPDPPEPFITLCLVRGAEQASLRAQANVSATVVTQLAVRDVLSVTTRTQDSAWVYATNKKGISGWTTAGTVVCTVPIEEIYLYGGVPQAASTASPAGATQPAATVGATIPAETPTPPQVPTQTPQPTPTATVVVSELNCTVVITNGLNVRTGPNTTFKAFIKLTEGQVFTANGRDSTGAWVAGRAPGGREGWVFAASVVCDGAVTALPVTNGLATAVPTPTSEPPTPEPTLTPVPPTLTPEPTLTPVPPTTAPTVIPPTATPEPTLTPMPPTATPELTLTPVPPTLTPVPTPTPVPAAPSGSAACVVITTVGVNVRVGPSKATRALSVAGAGEAFAVVARSNNSAWLLGTNAAGVTGWAVAGGLRCPVPIRTLPVSAVQIGAPTATPVVRATPASFQ